MAGREIPLRPFFVVTYLMQKCPVFRGFHVEINQFQKQGIDFWTEPRQKLGRNEAVRRAFGGTQVEKKRIKNRARPFGRKASSAFADHRCALEGDFSRYAICSADVFRARYRGEEQFGDIRSIAQRVFVDVS